MTELIYVPKRLVFEWMKKGWRPETPIESRDWAVLMSPPDWKGRHAIKEQEAGTLPEDHSRNKEEA